MPPRSPVGWVLLLGLTISPGAHGAAGADNAPSGPTRFCAMRHSFWDDGPMWDYHILDVKPEGNGALVRDILVVSVNTPCGATCTVRAKTRHVPNASPAELAGDNNPCAVDPGELQQVLRQSKEALKHTSLSSTERFGIVATCGAEDAVLHLPLLPFPFDRQGPLRIVRSYSLLSEVETHVFGTGRVFEPLADTRIFGDLAGEAGTEDDEIAGAALVPELRSGVFDRVLWDACKKRVCPGEGLKQVLESYVPPDQRKQFAVSFVSPDAEFIRHDLPAYPAMARWTHIEGEVEVALRVDLRTGAVLGAEVLSGHELLKPGVLQAAQAWRLKPHEDGNGSRLSRVKLLFKLNCPPKSAAKQSAR